MKQRMVSTRFWIDGWISNLDPVEKLLFLYLITNGQANLCGIYELPIKNMSIETGIEKEMVLKILNRFSKDDKVHFVDGWVYVKNAQKHQRLTSESVLQGIEREKSEIPAEILHKIEVIDTTPTPSTHHVGVVQDSRPNLTKPNLTKESGAGTAKIEDKDRKELLYLFKEVNPNYETLFARPNQAAALARMVKRFGREKVESVIRALPEVICKRFAPRVTTPIQLENKLGELVAFIKQEQAKGLENKNKVGIIT